MKYLIRKRKPKVKHIVDGKDTKCRMASTGGLNIYRYRYVEGSNLRTCTMCKNNNRKSLSGFDVKKRQALDNYRARIELDRQALTEARKRGL